MAPAAARYRVRVKETHSTDAGRYLVWLVVQSWVLLPMGLGELTVESLPDAPWGYRLINAFLIAGGGFLVIRNLVRLWRAPAGESSRGTIIAMTLVGLLFTILSIGPLLESDHWSTKPLGVAFALIGAALLTVGIRDTFRLRPPQSRTAARTQQTPTPS